MPTYQYACKDCGHAFEQVQSFTDDSLTVCPRCDGHLRKVFNAVGVVFKGSGFYRTDSRSPGDGQDGGDAKSSEDKSPEKPGEKTGAKTGEKPGAQEKPADTGTGGKPGGRSAKPSSGGSSGQPKATAATSS